MGQQQLLLLVLSTVIVGLATVAGIQAFSENQEQATQDALTQRALSIGNDIYSAAQKPSQLGGISLSDNKSTIASAAGFDGKDNIPADGAGESADCEITSTGPVKITCASDGNATNSSSDQTVVATVNSNGPNITKINGSSVGT